MSDLQTVNEMADGMTLGHALKHHRQDAPRTLEAMAASIVVDRVAERVHNPDLRAGAIAIIGEEPPDGYPDDFDWEDSIQAVIEQTVKPIIVAVWSITEDVQ